MKRTAIALVVVSFGAVAGRLVAGCSRATCAETETCPGTTTDAATGDGSYPVADGAPLAEGSVGDGAADGQDGAAGATASGDGGHDAEGGEAGGYCASISPSPSFCDDFDEHPLPGDWSSVSEIGGALSEDHTSFVSSPSSLLADDDALDSGKALDTAVRTQFQLPAPPDPIALEVQLEPVAADSSAGAATVVAALDFTDAANNRYTVQLTVAQQGVALGMRLEEQSGFVDGGSSYLGHPLADPLASGEWTDIRLVISRTSAMAASAHVTFNGAPELDTPLTMTVDAKTLQLTIGSSFETEPSEGWKNRYDNVRLDLQ
jgi:hypothetical protein